MGAGPVGPEWAADVEIDGPRASRLIRSAFPQFRFRSLRLLDEGWDNTVYLADDRWVFRFPRRERAVGGVAREAAILPRLAPRLPIAIPKPVFVATPTPAFPWPFWGAALLPGREWADAPPPGNAIEVAAGHVGAFLRALHDLDPTAPELETLPVDPNRRADAGFRAALTRERLARLAGAGVVPAEIDALGRLLAAGDDVGAPRASSGPPVVLHGDLHVRHVLVDGAGRMGAGRMGAGRIGAGRIGAGRIGAGRIGAGRIGDGRTGAGRISGILDWGDLCLGSPSVDVAFAFAALDGPARAAFFGEYGRLGAEDEVRARVMAAFTSAALVDYARDTQRPGLFREALAGLSRTVSGFDGGRA